MEHRNGSIDEQVEQFCQQIWDQSEDNPGLLPAEVTINNVGTGIVAKRDEDGLFFEANGEEFDIDGLFMQNRLDSDTLGIKPVS